MKQNKLHCPFLSIINNKRGSNLDVELFACGTFSEIKFHMPVTTHDCHILKEIIKLGFTPFFSRHGHPCPHELFLLHSWGHPHILRVIDQRKPKQGVGFHYDRSLSLVSKYCVNATEIKGLCCHQCQRFDCISAN